MATVRAEVQPARQILLFLAGLIPSLIVTVLAYLLIPQFIEMYRGFGMALPMITWLLFAIYRWYILLPILVLAVWLILPVPHKGNVAAALGAGGSILLLLFSWWGAYQPLLPSAAN